MRQGLVFSIIVLAVFCAPVWGIGGDMGVGTEPLTDGSEIYPYLIEDLEDFSVFESDPNYWVAEVHIRLMTDIDLSGRTYTQALIASETDSVTPGFQGTKYDGFFDGNGYVIANMTIDQTTEGYLGFFGYIGTTGQVKNLGVENVEMNGGGAIGGLAGTNYGLVFACYVTGSVEGISNLGGLVGFNGDSGKLTSCYSTCDTTGSNTGIHESSKAGGLVGDNRGEIVSCYATGTVSVTAWSPIAGGLVGSDVYGTIKYSYSTGLISGSGYYVGGLVGKGGSSIIGCFWDIQTSGKTTSDGGKGKTTAQMKDIQTYLDAGWTFIQQGKTFGDWIMPENSYPKLACQIYSPVTIPNLRGLTEVQAQDILDTLGLLRDETHSVYDPGIDVGLVSETYPQSGSIIYAELISVNILIAKDFKYSGGDGVDETYQIAHIGDWVELINTPADWDKSFVLTNNINLAGQVFVESPIAPATSSSSSFQGTKFTGLFDGNGHTISKFTIVRSGKYVGMFGCLGTDGQIKNLFAENVNITGYSVVGGLAGENMGTLTNCHVSGSIAGEDVIGGIVGLNKAVIADCYATGSVNAKGDGVGGLIGRNDAVMTDCYTTSSVNGEGLWVGGLIGWNSGILKSCYATGSVNGESDDVGGLIGINSGGTLTSCYATGSVNGNSTVGGLVGNNQRSTIQHCYATGAINGQSYVGGFVGWDYYSIHVSCFWDIQTSGQTIWGDGLGLAKDITGKTTSEMMTLSTFANAKWKIVDEVNPYGDWIISDNSYPKLTPEVFSKVSVPNLKGLTEVQAREELEAAGILVGENYPIYDTSTETDLISETYPQSGSVVYAGLTPVHVLIAKEIKYSGGDGITEPYEIAHVGDWVELMNNPEDWDKSFILMADINLAGQIFTQAPIAPDTSSDSRSRFQGTPFVGIFDGNGHKMRGLTINAYKNDYLGLFGYVGNGQIVNLWIEDVCVFGNAYVSGLVGQNHGVLVSCHMSGLINGYQFAGGLVGENYNTLMDCHTTGLVIGDYSTGGLLGRNYIGNLDFCYSKCLVKGGESVGGLVGTISNQSDVDSCYSTNVVIGANNVGGLVGRNASPGDLTACYSTGSVNGYGDSVGGLVGLNSGELTRCYATGSVSGSAISNSDQIGGLVGWSRPGRINQCYATGSVNGRRDVGGLVGDNDSTIIACYATGSVTGRDARIGGLTGGNSGGRLYTSYATGAVSGKAGVGGLSGDIYRGVISQCYAVGLVSGTKYVGGLVGSQSSSQIADCLWDIETSGQTTSAGGTGKTTAEMMIKSTFTASDWDFVVESVNGTEDIWFIRKEMESYPQLWWENIPSVADSGEDQVLYAWVDGLTEVVLDGTGSYDEDGDALAYYWYDGNDLIGEGAEPNVVLGVGEHVIDLIVNDGIDDSEPNSCIVTVIEPFETMAKMLPGVINLKTNRPQLIGRIEFAGETMPVLDPNEPMQLFVGQTEKDTGIDAGRQMLVYCEEETTWYLVGFFDSKALFENLTTDTEAEMTLVTRFESGQWVYGKDTVRVK